MRRLALSTNRFLWPLFLAGIAAAGSAMVAAVVLAVVDLYVTGHGGDSIRRPWLDWGPLQLSLADVLLLAAAALAGTATFILARRDMASKRN